MTQYIIVDNNDITRLVCEENIVVKTDTCNLVICTEEYYANVIAVGNYLNKECN